MAERLSVAYVASRYPKLTETSSSARSPSSSGRATPCSASRSRRATARTSTPTPAPPRAGAAADRRGARRGAALLAATPGPAAYARLVAECLARAARSPRTLARTLAALPLGALVGRIVAERRIDHVHAHWATHPTTTALVAGRLAGVPFSLTAHAHDIQVDTTLLAWKLRRAAFAVAVSDWNRSRLLAARRRPRRGRAVRRRHPRLRPASGAGARRRPARRVHRAPRSAEGTGAPPAGARAARRARPARALRPLGGGGERARLERLAARLRLDGVAFHGPLGSADVRRVLADAHAMVLPSVVLASGRTEGLPVALKEAMAMGVPVVASRVTGVPELVRDGETGLLVEPGIGRGTRARSRVSPTTPRWRAGSPPPVARSSAPSTTAAARRPGSPTCSPRERRGA